MGEFGGDVDLDDANLIAGLPTLETGHAGTFDADLLVVLGAGTDLDRGRPVKRRHLHLPAKRGRDKIDRRIAVNLLSLSRKYGMRLDRDGDKEVAGRTAIDPMLSLIGQPKPHAPFDAGGNVDGQQPFLENPLASLAGLAWFGDDMAASAAVVTGPTDAEESLLQTDLA